MEYDKVLAKMNNFCIDSGIREYCSTICKGGCCNSMLRNKECGELCIKSINCTFYFCGRIKNLLPKKLEWKYDRKFNSYINRFREHRSKLDIKFFWGVELPNSKGWPDPTKLIREMSVYINKNSIREMREKYSWVEERSYND